MQYLELTSSGNQCSRTVLLISERCERAVRAPPMSRPVLGNVLLFQQFIIFDNKLHKLILSSCINCNEAYHRLLVTRNLMNKSKLVR